MASWVASTAGFAVSVAGALAIAWPVGTRKDDDITLATMTAFDLNISLQRMLQKERGYARWGVVLVVVGASLQLAATWLPG